MPPRLARSPSPTPESRTWFPWIWALSALALSSAPAAERLTYSWAEQLRLPSTPLDRTSVAAAQDWAFLQHCRRFVPPKAGLTVLAADPEEAGALFMLALGVFPDNPVWPSTYYGSAPPEAERAEYVLVFRGAQRPPGLEVLAEWERGAVCRRRR